MIKVDTSDNNKLVFPNESNSMEQEEETTEEVPVVTEYKEEEDPDFNPAYCGETLSDCDENENGENEQNREVNNLNGDGKILKLHSMIPFENRITQKNSRQKFLFYKVITKLRFKT